MTRVSPAIRRDGDHPQGIGRDHPCEYNGNVIQPCEGEFKVARHSSTSRGQMSHAATVPRISSSVPLVGRSPQSCGPGQIAASSGPTKRWTLSRCDPIFFHHTAILWARLHGMNSTPTSKSVGSRDALAARADERLAHAHEEMKRADEQLARLSEQVAKMERDAARPPSAGSGPQPPPRRPTLRLLLPLAACVVVAALVLQSSYGGGPKVVVASRVVSTPSLPPENPPLPGQPAPSIVQVAAAETAPPQATPVAQTVPQSATNCRSTSRSDTVAANDGARSRELGAKHGTAQGKPTTNSQRQFKSHCGAQGEPGRDKTRPREGFRAELAQDVTAPDAAGSDLAQA